MLKQTTLALLLLCCSCIQLAGSPAARQHYRLSAPAQNLIAVSHSDTPMVIHQLAFPALLDRPQIVTYSAGQSVDISNTAYWAEPLKEALPSALRRNLRELLPAAQITIAPWENQARDALILELIVHEFSAYQHEKLQVAIDWTLKQNDTIIDRGRFNDHSAIDETEASLVEGLSFSLTHLAQEFIEKIKVKL